MSALLDEVPKLALVSDPPGEQPTSQPGRSTWFNSSLISVGTVDRFLQNVANENGAAVAKMTRLVLSGSEAWPHTTTH